MKKAVLLLLLLLGGLVYLATQHPEFLPDFPRDEWEIAAFAKIDHILQEDFADSTWVDGVHSYLNQNAGSCFLADKPDVNQGASRFTFATNFSLGPPSVVKCFPLGGDRTNPTVIEALSSSGLRISRRNGHPLLLDLETGSVMILAKVLSFDVGFPHLRLALRSEGPAKIQLDHRSDATLTFLEGQVNVEVHSGSEIDNAVGIYLKSEDAKVQVVGGIPIGPKQSAVVLPSGVRLQD